MALHIQRLEIDEFRGYSHLVLDELVSLNVIAGPNAVGKTNLIEAIQLLTSASSFRKPPWSETVSWGARQARLSAHLTDGVREIDHRLIIEGNEHSYEINGKKKQPPALCADCPCVLFIPDDLQMVKSSSKVRRDAVDDLGMQLSKNYGSLRSDYQQVLRQRNMLIREDLTTGNLFESWNESLACRGARLCVNRWRLTARLAKHLERIYSDLVGGEEVKVLYQPSWERFDEQGSQIRDIARLSEVDECIPSVEQAEEMLLDTIHRLIPMEERRHASLAGPHKDEIAFFINGANARLYASQGQQRTLVLCWKLAQVELIDEITGQQPVLLLDDVMSELDETRRTALAHFVHRSAQTFITTANLGYFSSELLESAKVVKVPIEGTRHMY